MAKCLEILKEILPKLRRVVTFYNPANQGCRPGRSLVGARGGKTPAAKIASRRQVKSADEFRQALQALKAGEADAYFYTPDAMVPGQAQLIIDTAKVRKLPTMLQDKV